MSEDPKQGKWHPAVKSHSCQTPRDVGLKCQVGAFHLFSYVFIVFHPFVSLTQECPLFYSASQHEPVW